MTTLEKKDICIFLFDEFLAKFRKLKENEFIQVRIHFKLVVYSMSMWLAVSGTPCPSEQRRLAQCFFCYHVISMTKESDFCTLKLM